jgi:predicted phage tail protein
MIRTIKLYGALEKAASKSEYELNVDTQQQLWAALRSKSQKLDIALRRNKVCIAATDKDGNKAKAIHQGFSFSPAAEVLHIVAHTEGAAVAGIWLVVEMIAVAVVVSVVSSMLISTMTNKHSSGGQRSTMFNGPINSTEQGGPIPIVYGLKCLVGSTIISVDEDYYNTVGNNYSLPSSNYGAYH